MYKRRISIFTIFAFMISLLPMISQTAYAYQNSAYFNELRVALTSMSSTSMNLLLNGSYVVNGQAYPSGTTLKLAISGTSLTLNGATQSQVEIVSDSASCLLSVTSGTVTNKYMGSFVFKLYNGKILPINSIDMESYLKGVVGYEMSDYFPIESLKAQAVAARNYALSRIGYEASKGYDFDDTTMYQVYKGYNSAYSNVINAVEQTRGQVLLYNDKLVETLYSAAHGGISENSENVWGNYVPYLRSVVDSYENNPWPNGNVSLSNASVKNTLVSKGYLTTTDSFVKLDLASITKYPSGRVSNINIVYTDATGTTKTKSVIRDATRTFLSLPSNLYTVVYDGVAGVYTFSGKGNGHGLGMSQIGAKNRAAAGQTFDQIMRFYYQNAYMQSLISKAVMGNVTQSADSVLVGGEATFTASATAGNGQGYLFKYVVKNGEEVMVSTNYSNNPTFNFVADRPGQFSVQAYVKDVYSVNEYDDAKTLKLTVYDNSVITGYALSKSKLLTGQQVSTLLEMQGGSGNLQIKYEVARNGEITAVRDFSSEREYSYTPSLSGSYTETVYVKDALSKNEYDLKESQNFTVYDPVIITAMERDVKNPFTGDTVSFSSSIAAGSDLGASMSYVLRKDGNIVGATDYSNSTNASFKLEEAGRYTADAYAKDALSLGEADATRSMSFDVLQSPSLSSVQTDKAQYLAGQTMKVDANASMGSGSYLYQYTVSRNGAAVAAQDFSTVSSFEYLLAQSGTYDIVVSMKDALSNKEYDDKQSLTVQASDQPTMKLTGSSNAVVAGTAVDYGINAAGGSGRTAYRFVVYLGGSTVMDSGYASAGTFTFIPTEAGSYRISGYAKDELSNNSFDAQDTVSLDVYKPQLGATTVNGSFFEGKPLNLDAAGSGASPAGLSYKFEIASGGAIKAAGNFADAATFSFTPGTSGSYSVSIYGKDGLSTNSYDCIKQFNIEVSGKPLYLSKLPLSQGATGNDVLSLQNALVKLGYFTGSADGYFGKSTKNAVISFQRSRGLSTDGIVGSMTYAALNEALMQKAGTKTLTY